MKTITLWLLCRDPFPRRAQAVARHSIGAVLGSSIVKLALMPVLLAARARLALGN